MLNDDADYRRYRRQTNMNISRKEFFRHGLLSLGKTALEIAGTISPETIGTAADNPEAVPACDPHPDLFAEPLNEHCLTKSNGCSECIARCEPVAIKLISGVGIRINPRLCNGCSCCEYVCPATPKAITMQSRPTQTAPEADFTGSPPVKKG
jgi:Pyruvate/2-oxoacid:ferredoxin oxidoreductase delta subunit